MRPVLLLAFGMLTNTVVWGQIPNAGFETWADSGLYLIPEGWHSPNESTAGIPGGIAIYRDSAGHGGSFAVKIQTTSIGIAGDLYAGVLTNGSTDTLAKSGDSISYKPARITGYYKYNGEVGDSSLCYLYLNRLNTPTNAEELVAGAIVHLGQASSWTYFEGEVLDAYLNAPDPTSFVIVAASTQNTASPRMGTLWLDDLAFSGVSAASTLHLDAALQVYPIPASETINVEMDGYMVRDVQLTNMAGVQVQQIHPKGLAKVSLDVTSLPEGVYVLGVTLDNGEVLNRAVHVTR